MGLNIVLRKAFEITNLDNAKISEKVAALQVVLTTYDKMWEVISGRPVLKEVIDKFMTKQKQLEEAANEIQKEREKDRTRNRLGLTAEGMKHWKWKQKTLIVWHNKLVIYHIILRTLGLTGSVHSTQYIILLY
jgi:hypothetical protein